LNLVRNSLIPHPIERSGAGVSKTTIEALIPAIRSEGKGLKTV